MSGVVKARAGDVDKTNVPDPEDAVVDAALWRALPWVAAGLAVVHLGFGASLALTTDGTDRLVLAGSAAGTAMLLAAVAGVARSRLLRPTYAHPFSALVVTLVVVNAVCHMVVEAEPRQSTTVLLAVVGAGVGLPSLRWFVATVYVSWGIWAVGAVVVGSDDRWAHYAGALALATGLAAVVNVVVRRAVRELATARSEAESVAVRDHLTGLANRRGLAMVGAQIVENARRQGDAVHCIFVDVDHLGVVNDQLGSAVGDEVLVAVGDAIRSVTRSTDVVARWGGDEFCLVGPGPGMAPLELERRVRDSVALHPPVPESTWSVRVSAGGAMLAPWDSGTLDTLLSKADQEMQLRRSLRRERNPAAPRRASAE